MWKIAVPERIRNHLGDRLVLNSMILMVMRLFAGFSGFIFWVLAARLMPAKEVGLASGTVAGALLLAGLGQVGLGYGLVRHLSKSPNPVRLVNTTMLAAGAGGAVLSVVFLAGLRIFSPALLSLQTSMMAMVAFLAMSASTAVTQLLGWSFLARRVPMFTLYKNTLQAGISLALLLVFRYLLGNTYLAALYAYTVGTILSLAVAVIFFLPRAEPGYHFQVLLPATFRGSFTKYILLNYTADQFSRAASTVIPLLVINVLGPADAAYFFVVWSLAAGLSSLDEAVSSSFFAEGANDPRNVRSFVTKSLKLGMGTATLVAVGTVIVSRFVMMVYGPEYAAHSTLPLIIVALALIPYSIMPIYDTFLRVRDQLIALILVSGADIGLGIVLMYVFMVRFGLVGATVGWLVSRFAILLVIAPFWKRQSQQLVVTKEVLDEQALG
jgi:O-antigen/teichoic acid export membrane protein